VSHIVIVNSRFLQRPQKRIPMNQLIHRHLIRTKSIGRGQDPENLAGRLWWQCFDWDTRGGEEDKLGLDLLKSSVFSLESMTVER